jgi:hypothetical protein
VVLSLVEEARLRQHAWAAFLSIHLVIVAWVSSQDILSLLANGHTSLPRWVQSYAQRADSVIAAAFDNGPAGFRGLAQVVTVYEHAGGIQSGYGFFAPAVPNSCKLVFEITYDDGRVEYELPRVNGEATGLRLSSLLDQIGAVGYDPLRELILKMLAYATWQEHPRARKVRAVFGFVQIPSAAEFRRGKAESYHFMYAYDFSFGAPQRRSP